MAIEQDEKTAETDPAGIPESQIRLLQSPQGEILEFTAEITHKNWPLATRFWLLAMSQ